LLVLLAACSVEPLPQDRFGAVVRGGEEICVRRVGEVFVWTAGATLRIDGHELVVQGSDGAPYPSQQRGAEHVIPCGSAIAVRGTIDGDRFQLFDTSEERARDRGIWGKSIFKLGLIFIGTPVLWAVFLFVTIRRYARIRRERRARKGLKDR
jgi:hypothetical protein